MLGRISSKLRATQKIIENVKQLSEKERRELVAYIVQLDESKEDSYIDRIKNDHVTATDLLH